jgi:hypothetical protein
MKESLTSRQSDPTVRFMCTEGSKIGIRQMVPNHFERVDSCTYFTLFHFPFSFLTDRSDESSTWPPASAKSGCITYHTKASVGRIEAQCDINIIEKESAKNGLFLTYFAKYLRK